MEKVNRKKIIIFLLFAGFFAGFTGYAQAQQVIINDPGNASGYTDVGVPIPPFAVGTLSGWDIRRVIMNYNAATDVMSVSFDLFDATGIMGDADGDGNASTTSPELTAAGGIDEHNLGGTESAVLLIDTDGDNQPEVAVGVHNNTDITSFSVYNFSPSGTGFTQPFNNSYWGSQLASNKGTNNNPSAGDGDLNFTIVNFSTLPGFSFSPGESFQFGMVAFGGSQIDDGIGEDYVPGMFGTTIFYYSDYGDAPDSYSTTNSQNGPHHLITSGIQLGGAPDGEVDGQPNVAATGDDIAGSDDEDGISFTTDFKVGRSANVRVVVTGSGYLNGWIDWNADGDFADAGEQIINNQSISSGTHNYSVSVPSSAAIGYTYSRFRYSSTSGLSYNDASGGTHDGEVEDYRIEIFPQIDWGDAPESGTSYPTTNANNGARHIYDFTTYLGSSFDEEDDGQPTTGANGDDNNGIDDEDGITFSTLTRGQSASVNVTVSAAGQLEGWIDFNDDGDWNDAGERIFNNRAVAGSGPISFTVPATATPTTQTYARFRYSTAGVASYTGEAPDGEVEDYTVAIEDYLDFGDAPASYPVTLSNNGARHFIDGTYYLGTIGDDEADGQPSAAVDDDNDGNDDEDGVTFNNTLTQGQQANITVSASTNGSLDAWADFNADGDWNDSGEQIFTNESLSSGSNSLSFLVPVDADIATTYLRFRFSSTGGLSTTGACDDGEVEDYAQAIEERPLDFGDAPDSYNTLRSNSGAMHTIVTGWNLGANIDAEADGQPTVGADGDDTNGAPDDEDGVTFDTSLRQAQQADITVNASQAGVLDAWIDFNIDGDWGDAGEKIFTNQALSSGNNSLSFNVPSNAQTGNTYLRFRFTSSGVTNSYGAADEGEVEDYRVEILDGWDFSDAPESGTNYPTTLATGARHEISSLYMGANIDIESDGQPTVGADGDDINGTPDDEDGVTLPASFVQNVSYDIIVNVNGISSLNAWIDWNDDGDWGDAGEQIFSDESLISGNNTLTVNVPAGAVIGDTYARFRVNSTGGLSFSGAASDGEVEDYIVTIEGADPQIDIEKATNSFDADNPTGPHIPVGGTVNWTYVVTNPGNVDLSNVIVTDDNGTAALGDEFNPTGPTGDDGDGILEVGETWNYSYSGTAVSGQYANNGHVDGDFGLTTYSDDDSSHYYGDEYDFGDAPESGTNYPTTLATGARHVIGGPIYLGSAVDDEIDGQPTAGANGDDTNGSTPDDEDGVSFDHSLRQGQQGDITVIAAAAGLLDAWIDFNDDGDWQDAGEQIFNSQTLSVGSNNLNFIVPGTAVQTAQTYARFRFSSGGGLTTSGSAPDGEVEDYTVAILAGQDFGDLPDPVSVTPGQYPTLSANNGARHDLLTGFYLGSGVDADADGQPNVAATGDDTDGNDDEDGVSFGAFVQGQPAAVTVTASAAGNLNAWIDWSDDGDFDDANEQVFNDLSLSPGVNNLTVSVPLTAVAGQKYSRFRFSSASGLSYNGQTGDGEVEDYRITVEAAAPAIDIEKATNTIDADDPTGPYIQVGNAVNWRYTVTNTGNVPLSSVAVSDNILGAVSGPASGDINTNSILEVNETWIYNTSGTALTGQYANNGHVQGDYSSTTVIDNDSSHYFGYTAAVDIEKATNTIDADDPTGPSIYEGNTVTWTYVVTNLSNVALNDVSVSDDHAGVNPVLMSGDLNTNDTLEVTETWTYEATGTALVGQYANEGTVTADDPNDNPVTDADSSHYIGIPYGGIGDYVWLDLSTDGIQDGSEKGVDSVWVYLYEDFDGDNIPEPRGDDGSPIDSMQTDTTGYYYFTDVPSGDYFLDFSKPDTNYVFTLKDQGGDDRFDSDGDDANKGITDVFALSAGQSDTTRDAGVYLRRGSIGDYVWHDKDGDKNQDYAEKGIANVEVNLYNFSTKQLWHRITDADGWYDFTNLAPGLYSVTVTDKTLPLGYYLTTTEPLQVALSPGEDYNDADFGYKAICSIGDYVWEDINRDGIQDAFESGIPDITVVLLDTLGNLIRETSTDADGYYLFSDLEENTYIVDVNQNDPDMPANYLLTTGNEPMKVHVNEGEQFLDADFGYMTSYLGVIGDYTWHDKNWNTKQDPGEGHLSFIYVFLYKNGAFVDSMATDWFGYYHFTGLQAGNYRVDVNRYYPGPDGRWRITTLTSRKISLAEGEIYLDADFGYAYRNEGWGEGRRWILARYQPWYGDAENDSTFRHWDKNYSGGHTDTSQFGFYDSYDSDMHEYQILHAWACGIDGFAADWYGKISYENPSVKMLLDKADLLNQKFGDRGFNFEIAVSYNEMALDRLDTNFVYLGDTLMNHRAYWGKRRGVRRPVFIYNEIEDTVITPAEYRACGDTILPPDYFLLWNNTEKEAFKPMNVCYPWVQPLHDEWDPAGQEWGETYLDTTYWRMNHVADPGDLYFALGAVWPGFDDRDWSEGEDHWMSRQDTLVYEETWRMVHEYNYPLSMPWVMVETWNDYNQSTEIEPSLEYDYKFNVLTRDHARIFKFSLPPDSVGVENPGLLVPQHILQARRAAKLRPAEASSINSMIEQALDKFFEKDHYQALYLADKAAGIAPKPFTIDSVSGTSVTLSWTRAEHANAYNIYYSRNAETFEPCSFTRPDIVLVGDITNYTLTGLDANSDYYIAVTAVEVIDTTNLYVNCSWYENTITGARVKSFSTGEVTSIGNKNGNIPKEFALKQNYPNPFNPTTTIEYALPKSQHVVIKIYDMRGREVKTVLDEYKEAGWYNAEIDISDFSSGVYFYRLKTDEFNRIHKMLLIK